MFGATFKNTSSAQLPQHTSPTTTPSPSRPTMPIGAIRGLHGDGPPSSPPTKPRHKFGQSNPLFDDKPAMDLSMYRNSGYREPADTKHTTYNNDPRPLQTEKHNENRYGGPFNLTYKPLWSGGLFGDRCAEFQGIECPKAREFVKTMYEMTGVEVARTVGDAIEKFLVKEKPRYEMLENVARMVEVYSRPAIPLFLEWWVGSKYFDHPGRGDDIIDVLKIIREVVKKEKGFAEKKGRLKKWEVREKKGRGFYDTFGHHGCQPGSVGSSGREPSQSAELAKEATDALKVIAQKMLDEGKANAATENDSEKWTGYVEGVPTSADHKVNSTFRKMRPGVDPYWAHALHAVDDTLRTLHDDDVQSTFTYPRDVYYFPVKFDTYGSLDPFTHIHQHIVRPDSEYSEEEGDEPSKPVVDPQLAARLGPERISRSGDPFKKHKPRRRSSGETIPAGVPITAEEAESQKMNGNYMENITKTGGVDKEGCDELSEYVDSEEERDAEHTAKSNERVVGALISEVFAQAEGEKHVALDNTDTVVEKVPGATQELTRDAVEETEKETTDIDTASTQGAVKALKERSNGNGKASNVPDAPEQTSITEELSGYLAGILQIDGMDKEIIEALNAQQILQDDDSEHVDGNSEVSPLTDVPGKLVLGEDVICDETDVLHLNETDKGATKTASEKKVVEEKAAEPSQELVNNNDEVSEVKDTEEQTTSETTSPEKVDVTPEVITIEDTPASTPSVVSALPIASEATTTTPTGPTTSTTGPTIKTTKNKKPASSKCRGGTPPNITPASVIADKIKLHNAKRKKPPPLTNKERAECRKAMEAAMNPDNFASGVVTGATGERKVKQAKGAKKGGKGGAKAAKTQEEDNITFRPELHEAANAARGKGKEVVPTTVSEKKKRRVSQVADEDTQKEKTPAKRNMAKRKSTSPANDVTEFASHMQRRPTRLNSGSPCGDNEKQKQPEREPAKTGEEAPPRRSPRKSGVAATSTQSTETAAITANAERVETEVAPKVTWRARRPKMNLRKCKVVDSDEVEPVQEEHGLKRRRRV